MRIPAVAVLATFLALTASSAPAARPAPVPAPLPVGPAEAVLAAAEDLRRVAPGERRHVRYLWAANPAPDFRAAFKLHYNLLSRYAEVVDVVEVRPWLWRLDLREPRWSAAVWEKAAEVDVYFHQRVKFGADVRVKKVVARPRLRRPGAPAERIEEVRKGQAVSVAAAWLDPRAVAYLRQETVSEAPILMAEWLLAQSCRQVSLRNKETGLGYADFLELPNRNAYFKLIGLDEKVSLNLQREVRAAVELSGVSQANRQVVRLGAASGGAWVTLDTNDQAKGGVAIRNLERGQFKHNAEEWYGFLPNNLPAVYLSDDKGVRQASAPDFIGPDDSPLREGRDGRIHLGVSCIGCHAGTVLRPVDDYVRKTFRKRGPLRLSSYDKKTYLDLKRQYLSNLDRFLERDRAEYRDAILEATKTAAYPKGIQADRAAKVYLAAYHAYATRPVTLAVAAREVGVTTEVFVKALKAYDRGTGGQTDLALAAFLDDPPGQLSRLTWEDSYVLCQTVIRGLVPARLKE